MAGEGPGLVDRSYARQFRAHYGENEFVRGASHSNGIEPFWTFAKLRLAKFKGIKFKGIPVHTFYLGLKEAEFRWNH